MILCRISEMRRHFILFFLFIVASFSPLAQKLKWDWVKTYTTSLDHTYTNTNIIHTDAGGSILLVNNFDSGVTIRKCDAAGNELWKKHFSGDIVITGLSTGNSDVYLCGHFREEVIVGNEHLSSHGKDDLFFLRMGLDGDIEWLKHFGGKEKDQAGAVCTDANGNVYCTGYYSDTLQVENETFISECPSKMFVIKYDKLGNVVFLKSSSCVPGGGNSYSAGEKIGVDSEGNIYVAGTYSYFYLDTFFLGEGGGPYAARFLCKLDASGETKWLQRIFNYTVARMTDLKVTSGQIVITGMEWWTNGGEAITEKYALDGNNIWNVGIGGHCWGDQGRAEGLEIKNSEAFVIGSLHLGVNCTSRIKLMLVKYNLLGARIIFDTLQAYWITGTDIAALDDGYIITGIAIQNLQLGDMNLFFPEHRLFIARFREEDLIGLEESSSDLSSAYVYPNPTHGEITFTVPVRSTKIRLIDMRGEVIYESNSSTVGANTIETGTFPSGVYCFQMESEKEIVRQKIVIE